ncbi:hypothetical protein A5624_13880 [Mycobacterium sp. 1482292.6]|nr:hypothetical protein A5624_13880 [Mycobacterium sp. 1482292.6]
MVAEAVATGDLNRLREQALSIGELGERTRAVSTVRGGNRYFPRRAVLTGMVADQRRARRQ